MIAVELRFPAGRYHATPFGRNVNEGIPEWPPSPYRLARALVDTCFRKAPEMQGERLEKVLGVIASPVSYLLPKVNTGHARYFLSENLPDRLARQKVFDPFVIVDRSDSVLVFFEAEPERETLFDLKHLLGFLNYFGRSESWVSAGLVSAPAPPPNCSEESRPYTQPVEVACLKPRADYERLKHAFQAKGERTLDGRNWVEALCIGTGELKAEGWNHPPAMTPVTLYIPENLVDSGAPVVSVTMPTGFRQARYSVSGKVKPLITDGIILTERLRRKLMGIHRRVMGNDPEKLSSNFSGKQPDSSPMSGHDHSFYLTLDLDEDGRIDTFVVTSNTVFTEDEITALNSLDSIWQEGGRGDLDLVLVGLFRENHWMEADTWESVTPFVTLRHHRKGRGDFHEWLKTEVQKELAFQGLPAPVSIEMIPKTPSKGHSFHWIEFIRSRKGETPRAGYGFRLVFDQPVMGPFAIGAFCHFGSGVFLPARRDTLHRA